MLEMLVNSKAGASAAAEAAKGLFGSDNAAPIVSGGTADMRASFNNSGWTVATGASKSDAKNTGDPMAATYGVATLPNVQAAGLNWPMVLALGGMVLLYLKKKAN